MCNYFAHPPAGMCLPLPFPSSSPSLRPSFPHLTPHASPQPLLLPPHAPPLPPGTLSSMPSHTYLPPLPHTSMHIYPRVSFTPRPSTTCTHSSTPLMHPYPVHSIHIHHIPHPIRGLHSPCNPPHSPTPRFLPSIHPHSPHSLLHLHKYLHPTTNTS